MGGKFWTKRHEKEIKNDNATHFMNESTTALPDETDFSTIIRCSETGEAL
jgi:hypothetical protein